MKNSLLRFKNLLLTASLLATLAAAALSPSPALAAAGDLVPGFGTGGIATNDPSTNSDAINAIAIDASSIYMAGYDYSPGDQQWRIEKRNITTGALIASFGTSGVVASNPSSGTDGATAIALDGSGVYMAGWALGGNSQWRIEKRDLITGALISGFGTSGVVTFNPSSGADVAEALALDGSSLYIVGYDVSPGNSQWRIEKRDLTTGALISGFGTSGVVTSNPSSILADQAKALAIDSTYMYVVGYDSNTVTSNYQWRIEKRRLDTGALCAAANCGTEFGTGGAATSDPSTSTDIAYAIAIDSTYLYVSGVDSAPGYYRWRIEKRRLDTGALETAFDTDGIVTISPCAANALTYAIVIDSNAIYVPGYDSCSSVSQWRIEKRSLTTGALIANFGTNGVVTSDPSAFADGVYDMKIDSNGIYIAGYDSIPWNGNIQWRIEKRESGGTPPSPPPTVNLSAFPATIESGQSSTVSWTSTDATACAAVSPAGWTSSTATSGAETVWPVVTTTYIIECTGTGGTTQQSTTVTVDTVCGEGNLNWTQTYDSGAGYDLGFDVAVDSGDNIYITGYQGTNGGDIFLRKYDSTGNFQWMQTYNSGGTQQDTGSGVAVDLDGNIYVSGQTNILWDTVILLKYDSGGNFQWRQDYIGGDFRDGLAVAVDPGGNIYVTGYKTESGDYDMFLRKYDSAGIFQWMQTYNSGGSQDDAGKGVAVDSSGNIYVTGYHTISGDLDMFLRKYNSSGNFQWMQTYNSGPSENNSSNDVAVDSGGNIYVTGFRPTNGGDMVLRKYDPSGAFQWMQTYDSGPGQQDSGLDVVVDSIDNIYVAGSQQTNGSDIFLRKYDSSGAFQWMQTYNSGGAQTDYAFGVAVDLANNVSVVGRQVPGTSDAVLLQYDGSGCGFTPAPTVTLDAVPSTINSGDSSTLTWTSTDAASCAAVSPAGWTAKTTVNDSELVTNITATTTYIIACTGPGGTSQQSTTVTVSGGGGGGCGQQIYDGTTTITLSCEDPPVSPLRAGKDATTYGIQLVDPSDPNASKLRIQTPGGVKALRKQ